MKKMFMVLMVLALVVGTGIVTKQHYENKFNDAIESYQTEVDETKAELEQAKASLIDEMEEHETLESEVYKMMNDEEYNICIEHNGEVHNYYSKNKFFSNKVHMILTDN